MTGSGQSLRWLNYFLQKGADFDSFWGKYLESRRNILFIMGLGFDPRTCHAFQALVAKGGEGRRDCMIVEFDVSAAPKYGSSIKQNRIELGKLIPTDSSVLNKRIETLSSDGRRVSSRNAAKIIETVEDLNNYDDVVVDVSAMPRGIFFPLVGKILYLIDLNKKSSDKTINLHIVVSENANLDTKIRSESIEEDASYIPGFRGSLDTEGASGMPKVWIPILGEGQRQQMERIYEMVQPNEVSPILPMPSVNPRRADALLIEYRDLFFDRGWVEPGNFVYASEQNPFEVYRQLHKTIHHYNQALAPLGGCQAVISVHSSKLLSIGALLVSYELKTQNPSVGIAHVDTHDYIMERSINTAVELKNTELVSMWLAGECYEQ